MKNEVAPARRHRALISSVISFLVPNGRNIFMRIRSFPKTSPFRAAVISFRGYSLLPILNFAGDMTFRLMV